jgi:SOS-response transcriptional repressor LexA
MDIIKTGAQWLAMLTADDIRDEMTRQLDARIIKGVAVARHLGVAPARVTEMRNGERQVQQREMAPLAELLGMTVRAQQTEIIEQVAQIPYLGEVAQGIWLEQSFADPDMPEFVPYDRRPGDPIPDDMFSVTPKGTSMNLRFRDPGMRLICHRIPFTENAYHSGDLVIVERQAHDLCEMTCKRVEIGADGVHWLHSESDDASFAEPWRIGEDGDGHDQDIHIRIIARVLRGVIDYVRS